MYSVFPAARVSVLSSRRLSIPAPVRALLVPKPCHLSFLHQSLIPFLLPFYPFTPPCSLTSTLPHLPTLALSNFLCPSFLLLFTLRTHTHLSLCLFRKRKSLFQKYIFNIKQELKNVSYVCTTADIWSSRKRSFFGMTAHWITNECERKSTALACQRIKGTHSFDKIAEIVEEIHLKYSLTWNKVVGTVTDNGSNFVKAFKMYGIKTSILDFEIEEENMSDSESMSDSASESDESLRTWTEKLPNHIRCGSHTLNLCASADVKKTLNKNPALLNIHNQVLGKCNKLWKAAQRPKSAEIIEKSIGHTLTRPGETRWNSLYNALQQIMEIREKCGQLFKELGLKNSLNDREFEYIQEHLKCTKPVSEALDILQGEKNTFYGILIPTLLILKRKLENLQREQWIYCQPLVDSLLNSVTSRFEDIFNFSSQRSETAVIAALTLPRFKNRWFSLVDIRHHERILYLLKRIVAQELSLSLQTTLSNQIASSRSKEDEFFDFGDQDDSQSTQTWVPMGDLEIFHYLGDPDSQISCLEKYPTIKKVFLKYNTLIPSSAPVERLFSFATMINTAKSHRLSDTMFEKRVLLKAFLNKNVSNKK